ncbi:MAG: hypothetical protein AB2669_00530 [Candidatus Thiodiazotropha endolucinida]
MKKASFMTGTALAAFMSVAPAFADTTPATMDITPTPNIKLSDYMNLNGSQQGDVIIGARSQSIASHIDRDPQRSLCLAGLFDEGETGFQQYAKTKRYLAYSAQKNPDEPAAQAAKRWMEGKLCPATNKDE